MPRFESRGRYTDVSPKIATLPSPGCFKTVAILNGEHCAGVPSSIISQGTVSSREVQGAVVLVYDPEIESDFEEVLGSAWIREPVTITGVSVAKQDFMEAFCAILV